ncbi:hypothetical protein [Parvicella tangerina]|uniref:Uncharacterized protein n=1 Tax=Parvicella tangerina TaxID=2829795 RepID=A0A916JLS4_9FLAO|nr:hypothetical protein [Parvicella tangerina]CAG5079819.1 hypothetical protein CRYO30217_01082 [Parvicella tangerina]
MRIEKLISVLVVLSLLFVVSCSKFEPLNEKKVESVKAVGDVDNDNLQDKALGGEDESGSSTITDPDHDEDHDKDDSAESKQG